jgi:hypothetical protein
MKRSSFGFNQGAKGQPKTPLVWRTGLSGVPPDMSGAPEDSNANSPPSGISRGDSAIIHRTVRCAPDSVRCAKGERPQELASFGKLQRLVRYNSPDCPVCTGLSGATPEQRLLGANGYLQRIECALCSRRSQARPFRHTGHPGGPTSQKLQRSESNGSDDVAGAPDMSGVHRTVRCAIEQTASQRPLLVVGL